MNIRDLQPNTFQISPPMEPPGSNPLNIKDIQTSSYDQSQGALTHSQSVQDMLQSAMKTPLQRIAEGNGQDNLQVAAGAAKQAMHEFSMAGAQNAGPVGAGMLAAAPEFAKNIDAFNQATKPQGALQNTGAAQTGIVSALATPESIGANKGTALSSYLVKRAAEKETSNVVKALTPSLTKLELQDMVAAGKGTVGKFGTPSVDFTKDPNFMKMVDATKGIVKGKSAVEDVNSLRGAISTEASSLQKSIADSTAIKINGKAVPLKYDSAELASRLDNVEEPISIRGTPFEKQVKPIKEAAKRIAAGKGDSVSGLLDARKEFDALVEKTYPNLYDKESAPMRNAITSIRSEMNQFIEDKLPKGSTFRQSLEKQRQFYNAIDNLLTKVHAEHGTPGILRSMQNFSQEHPVATGAIKAGGAVAGYEWLKDKLRGIVPLP